MPKSKFEAVPEDFVFLDKKSKDEGAEDESD